ncbi:methyl-accepting chemotaxis protein [Roseburia sp. 831b]|uniref:methyl-accepting chemotaxis protein n=1 Tax=Roseburia sp. 831b TaxID=1261635 RepID=UPI0009525C09|nr:methyl-accepting chemotaxis protein [Roseburia sp. 831b]WVK74079.1 methyl-accepting chemotaxis protein [Roseburia sp. 831b]
MKRNINFQSIRAKMLLALLLPVCLMIVLGVIAYDMAYSSIVKTFTESAEQSVSMTSDYMNFGLDKVTDTAVDYLVNEDIEKYFTNKMGNSEATTYQSDLQNDFVSKTDTDSFISGIYILGDDGYSISTSQKSSKGLYGEFAKTTQGKEAVEGGYSWCGNSSELDDMLEVSSDSYILRMAKKYYKNDIMLVMDIDKTAIVDILQGLDLGDGSLVSFVTKDDREIGKDGSEDAVFTGTKFYQMAKESDLDSGYIENVSYNGSDYMFLYAKVQQADALLCVLVPNKVIFSRVASIRYLIAGFVVIAAVLSALIGWIIVNGVNKSIRKLVGTFEKLSTGDFTAQIEKMSNDELGTLNRHVGNMIESVRKLIGNVDVVEDKVVESMDHINSATTNMADTSLEIRDSVNEMGERFNKQVAGTERCSGVMSNLSEEIQMVKDYTDVINQVAEQTQNSIGESQEQLRALQHRSTESINMNMEVVRIINDLNKSITDIENIIGVVNEIAGQTKLLALNASIEAARAGEMGKGFAVVAEEVGTLAEQSTKSTADINEIVAQIKGKILDAVNQSAKTKDVIALQEEALANTAEGFNSMKQDMEVLMEKFTTISEKVNDMENEKNASVESIEEIALMVNDNVDSMKEMIERINKQTDMAVDMSKLSQEVKEDMDQMDQSINQFKI